LIDFKEIYSKIGASGTYALRTSLKKLTGFDATTGILEDSVEVLRAPENCAELQPNWDALSKVDEENKLTVFKNTLLYANLNTGLLTWHEAKNNLKLLYPDVLVASEKTVQVPTLCRALSPNELEIIIPNRGYVFGGELQSGIFRGLDCSSFVSYCVDCSERLSTHQMELIWKTNFSNINSDDPVVLGTQHEFEAIPIEESRVKLGDLIVWRARTETSGHVAIFKEWIEPNKFIGIDDRRSDDKKFEGIRYREFLFKSSDSNTYILRRR
jgi:hypothetical protein